MKLLHRRGIKFVLVLIGLVVLSLACFYFRFRPATDIVWGVNFSAGEARYLGFDPPVLFNRILTDLHPGGVRLAAYWEDLEATRGTFTFSELDRIVGIAEQHKVPIIFVVGYKQPRWPECHRPEWYDSLSATEQSKARLDMVRAVVSHFKSSSAIARWQVENEPFFNYGNECTPTSLSELQAEISLVHSLDSRPIVVTDSGEKGDWFTAARAADVFGSTMYRMVHNPKYGGYITYPIPPAFYRIRAGMLLTFSHVRSIIGVELQAEPWFSKDIHDTTLAEQKKLMNPELFASYTNYAKAVGLSENYLWGAEWWYWLKDVQHDSSMWQAATTLFRTN